jgi:Zn finger protein HypA/HybF involved in hydrogenase expression
MTLQSQYDVLLAENNQLKQQLVAAEDWEQESQNYRLEAVASGVFVYSAKPDIQSAEPVHWLCANCYQNKQKSLLQRTAEKTLYGRKFHCPNCKTDIVSGLSPENSVFKSTNT